MDPLALSPVGSEYQTEPVTKKDSDLAAYRYARALCESARSVSSQRLQSLARNWDFLMGKDHWPKAVTTAAAMLDQWAFRGVVNWTYATVKTKASMITGSAADIFIEPLDEASKYYDRLLIKSAIEHELDRVNSRQVAYDCYISGSVTGVGVAMWSMKPDPLTGIEKLTLVPIKTDEFYRDPSADMIESENCRFVVWSPELDMSTIRQMWPSRAKDVKPEMRQVAGGWTYKPNDQDAHLITGTAGEFVVDQQNTLSSRKARVNFVWIRDEEIARDLQEVVLLQSRPGYQCVSCGELYEADGSVEGQCPTCGGNLENVDLPPKTQTNEVIRKAYPYGRLTVYSGDTLLYDGENPYEIETVFPFAIYYHDRIPGQFYGSNDVDMLKSLQEAQNTTVGQLIDYVRLSVNGPFEYPVGAKSYTEMGNGPAERHPVPDHLAGKAHYVSPQNFNVAAWSALHGSLYQHFQIVSGLGSIGFSQTSSPPISATEAEIANARLSDRMKGHAEWFGFFLSNLANIGYQMMKQFYSDPIGMKVQMPDSEVKSIQVEVQSLPKAAIRVVVNTQETVKDKLLGQNLSQFAGSGGLDTPYADIVLEALGTPANRIRELMERRGLQEELTGGPAPPPPQMEQPQPQEGGMPVG